MILTRTKSDWWQWSWRVGKTHAHNSLDQWIFDPQITDFVRAKNHREAIAPTLSEIRSETSDLVLFLSGGVDSESIMTEALKHDIPIKPVFCRFTSELNDHEEHYLKIFQRKHSIEVDIVELDVQHWLHTDTGDLSWRMINQDLGFQHPGLALLMWVRHQVAKRWGDITVIQGNGDLPIYGFSDPTQCGTRAWTVNYCWQANFATLAYYQDNYPTDIPYF